MARNGWKPPAAVPAPAARAPLHHANRRGPAYSSLTQGEAPADPSHARQTTSPAIDGYQALLEQTQRPEIAALRFEERLGLLVDRELTAREDRRLKTRLHKAKLRQTACIEDIDYRHPRGLDKSLMRSLATCQWIRDRHNVLITGPTGIGKTWLACALGHQACREGWTVLYLRLPRLLQEFPLAQGDGRYVKRMTALAKTDVLLLDAWGLAPLSADNRRDLLELLEDRHDCRATIVTSQLPVEPWHAASGEPTLADAILARLGHNAYKIALQGASMRQRQGTVPKQAPAMEGRPAQRRVAPSQPTRCGAAWLSWGAVH
jgi:DNA replication protein DnaC